MVHTAAPAATPTDQRILVLDQLRGIALLGILLANARQLLLPWDIADLPFGNSSPSWLVWLDWSVYDALIESKFLTLFSFLFGVSFALQAQRLEAQGAPASGIFVRRLALLALFGLLHGLLLYPAEVLLPYALGGAVLLMTRRWTPATQVRVGSGLLAMTIIWGYQLSGTGRIEIAQSALGIALIAGSLYGLRRRHWWMSAAVAASLAIGLCWWMTWPPSSSVHREFLDIARQHTAMIRGDWAQAPEEFQVRANGGGAALLALHVEQYQLVLLYTVLFLFWRNLAIFWIGAGLWRSGGGTSAARSVSPRMTGALLALGLLGSIAATVGRALEITGALTLAWPQFVHALSAVVLAAAFIAWMLGRVGAPVSSRRWPRWDSIGRMALSNYVLGQSLVLAAIAEPWGLKAYGHWDGPQLTALALGLFVLLGEGSYLWLRHFRMGPLEWLWRCGTYGRWLPLRHPRSENSGPPDAPS